MLLPTPSFLAFGKALATGHLSDLDCVQHIER
jgi:hypothetical protein